MKHKVGDRVVATNGVSGTVVKASLVPHYDVEWDQQYTTTVRDGDLKPKEK